MDKLLTSVEQVVFCHKCESSVNVKDGTGHPSVGRTGRLSVSETSYFIAWRTGQ